MVSRLSNGQRMRVEAAKKRREVELGILNGLPQGVKITIKDLWRLLQKLPDYLDVTEDTVRGDVNAEKEIRKHLNLVIAPRTTGRKRDQAMASRDPEVQKRIEAELKILNSLKLGERFTIRQLWYELKRDPRYGYIGRHIVDSDVSREPKLHNHLRLIIEKKQSKLENTKKRREVELEILNGLPKEQLITIVDLWNLLRKLPGYKGVTEATVRGDISSDNDDSKRIRSHANLFIEERTKRSDRAQSATGGIDMSHLEVGAKGGIKFHIDPAQLAALQNAPGFVPVIVSIEPENDLKGFLGLPNQQKANFFPS
jgi:hypothetical protein